MKILSFLLAVVSSAAFAQTVVPYTSLTTQMPSLVQAQALYYTDFNYTTAPLTTTTLNTTNSYPTIMSSFDNTPPASYTSAINGHVSFPIETMCADKAQIAAAISRDISCAQGSVAYQGETFATYLGPYPNAVASSHHLPATDLTEYVTNDCPVLSSNLNNVVYATYWASNTQFPNTCRVLFYNYWNDNTVLADGATAATTTAFNLCQSTLGAYCPVSGISMSDQAFTPTCPVNFTVDSTGANCISTATAKCVAKEVGGIIQSTTVIDTEAACATRWNANQIQIFCTLHPFAHHHTFNVDWGTPVTQVMTFTCP